MNCPICNSSYSDQKDFITTENFDGSVLYKNIVIRKCRRCEHLFNELETRDLISLMKYYEDEYAPINLNVEDTTDRPGSENPATIDRYIKLELFLSSHIKKDSRILDVGCATGGFLKFLKRKGYKNLYGIDPIVGYVRKANKKNIKFGSVYEIPFPDNSFDIVILDQVLEHLFRLGYAMKKIHRVLDKGGLCYIGVPDAERYNNIYFYLMREHLQHFKFDNIKLLAENHEFEVIDYIKTTSPMIGNLMLPNLSVLLKVRDIIYCWGIGREFMYLYPNTRLKHLKLMLVDDIPEKQKKTFRRMKIHSSEILKQADENSFLIITSLVHKGLLIKKAKELGFKGEIISV